MDASKPERRVPLALWQSIVDRRMGRTATTMGYHAAAVIRAAWHARAKVRSSDVLIAAAGMAVAVAALDELDAGFVSAWWLLVLVVIRSDIADFIIPDEASLGIAVVGLAYTASAAFAGSGGPMEWLPAIAAAAGNGLGAAVVLWSVGRAFRFFRGYHGLGFGDVKLAGASAIWLSPLQATAALQLAVLAALGAAIFIRRSDGNDDDGALPFGAFLAPAAWLVNLTWALAPDQVRDLWS